MNAWGDSGDMFDQAALCDGDHEPETVAPKADPPAITAPTAHSNPTESGALVDEGKYEEWRHRANHDREERPEVWAPRCKR